MKKFTQFIGKFGNIDSKRFGPIAMSRWLAHRDAGTYIRLLGIGDGKFRIKSGENAGRVNNAGFLVGASQVQATGTIGPNSYATENGPPGRTYILGCFMSESAGSSIFSDVGIQTKGSNKAHPIIRGILIAASGVHLSLNTEAAAKSTPSSTYNGTYGPAGDAGLSYGDILTGPSNLAQNFIVILNGFKEHGDYKNSITSSFDPMAFDIPGNNEGITSISRTFNTDPTKIEEAGHYLKSYYDIPTTFAIPTGSEITSHADTNVDGATLSDGANMKLYQTAFLLTSSLGRNEGSASTASEIGIPNFENFENRFTHSFTPWVISQTIQGSITNLFRFHTRDAGLSGANSYKITINGFSTPDENSLSQYPKFDIHLRKIDQSDINFGTTDSDSAASIETFLGVSLDPSDEINYICRKIGDQHTFYDFDKKDDEGQKIVVEGFYRGTSNLIRVEVAPVIADGRGAHGLLPVGFRGLYHLVTSGSTSILTGSCQVDSGTPTGLLASAPGISNSIAASVIQPPVPFREHISMMNPAGSLQVSNILTWGVQFENKHLPEDPNGLNTFMTSSLSFLDYMPDFHTNYQNPWVGDNHGVKDIGGCVLDADRFNAGMFTLENIEVLTSSDDVPDADQWGSARYRRAGKLDSQLANIDGIFHESRFLREKDFSSAPSQKYYSFTFPFLGGFDGTNIFDYDKSNFTTNAVLREINDIEQSLRRGPSVRAYEKALEILEDKTAHEGHLLLTPEMRHPYITNSALEMANRRFDIFYIMDIPEIDEYGTFMTSSANNLNLTNTRNYFLNDPKDTTFGAAYYPDVQMKVEGLETSDGLGLRVPPSVAVISNYASLMDHKKILGSNNGTPPDILKTAVNFYDEDLDNFFQSGINLISGATIEETSAGISPFIRSQHTFDRSLRPMTKIAIRRTILLVQREVRKIMKRAALFEPNDRATRSSLKDELKVKLAELQLQGVIKMFRIIMIKSPSTEAQKERMLSDKNNNILRFKIMILPHDASDVLIIDPGDEYGTCHLHKDV